MKNLFDLTGKVALIAGASSGIGVQFAKALASQGASLVIVARRYEKLKEVAKGIEAEYGTKVIPIKCDVRVEKEVQEAVEKTVETFGKIDILMNNAGIGDGIPVHLLEEADWDNVINTDIKGVYLMSKHALKYMLKAKYGRIINTASTFGITGSSDVAVHSYNAAKAAVINLTRGMAAFYAKDGITVNAIGPSLFYSEMTANTLYQESILSHYNKTCPMGRPGNPGELDGAAIYLASDASSYTTGQTIFVDGGWTSI